MSYPINADAYLAEHPELDAQQAAACRLMIQISNRAYRAGLEGLELEQVTSDGTVARAAEKWMRAAYDAGVLDRADGGWYGR